MPAPTFLCIGAQKSGTTWLARAVQQHPQVSPGKRKELHFFNHEDAYARGLRWYESQFRRGPRTRATGEFTPNYWWTVGTETTFHYLGCAERIADAYPDLQLVVCLRDPVARAVSAYFHHMNAGRYPPSVSLLGAIERYPDIREFGLYATQYTAWLERFPADRFLVLVYEEDIAPDDAKKATLDRVFGHIGVDPGFEPAEMTEVRNVRQSDFTLRLKHASPLRRRAMERLPRRVRESARWRIPVAESDRRALAEDFRPEVARLEEMLGRRLPWSLDG
jgi:hypothetical protein